MSKIAFVRIVEHAGRWRLGYHYADESTPEFYGDYPTEDSLEAELVYRGWAQGWDASSHRCWFPPELSGPISPAAAASGGTRGSIEIDRHDLFGLNLLLHHTMHPRLGHCWGFSYSLAKYVASDVEVPLEAIELRLRFVDPILSLLAGGLFEIECIGHFMTRQSAIRAGKELYNRVRKQLGDELLMFAISLHIRKELDLA